MRTKPRGSTCWTKRREKFHHGERHRPTLPVTRVVLQVERDPLTIKPDQPVIADRDPMRVASEISEDAGGQGRGRPVLLLHGNAGFVQYWSAIVPKLAAHYRVFAFDRPGHGASSRASARHVTPDVQARLIHAALGRLTLECPIVVGFSWGGGLSLIYALQYPGETCGLVLITPRAFPDEATRSLAYQLGRTPVLGDIFRHSVMLPIARRIIRDRLAAGYAPDSPVCEHVAAASDMWSRPGQAEATVWDSRNLDEALRSCSVRYHEITSPVVIVVGDHDRPDRESISLSRKIPGAELVVIPRTGHLIPQVRPQAVITAIDAVAARGPAIQRR